MVGYIIFIDITSNKSIAKLHIRTKWQFCFTRSASPSLRVLVGLSYYGDREESACFFPLLARELVGVKGAMS